MQQQPQQPQPRAERWGCSARRGWGRAGGCWTTWRAEGGRRCVGLMDAAGMGRPTAVSTRAVRCTSRADADASAAVRSSGRHWAAAPPTESSRGSSSGRGSTKSALSFISFVGVVAVCLLEPRCCDFLHAATSRRNRSAADCDPRQARGSAAARCSAAQCSAVQRSAALPLLRSIVSSSTRQSSGGDGRSERKKTKTKQPTGRPNWTSPSTPHALSCQSLAANGPSRGESNAR